MVPWRRQARRCRESTRPALYACSRARPVRGCKGSKVNFAGSAREGVTVGMPLVAGAVWRPSCKMHINKGGKLQN